MDQKSIKNNVKNSINNFNKLLENNNLFFSQEYINRFCYSLLAKPFLILTGNSGSGKTKIAQLFCKYLSDQSYTDKQLLNEALNDQNFLNKYKIKKNDSSLLEIINKNGDSGKIIPLPKDLILEWFEAFRKGIVTLNSNPKTIRQEIYNISKYQNFSHGFYANIFDIIKVLSNYDHKKNASFSTITTYSIIPVGADWMDNKPILGYYNPLTETYQSTQTIDLILDAHTHNDRPFFLILDEMNLSHIERYFSDFLSAMESGEKIRLHSEQNSVISSSGRNVPPYITMPLNLFVIGTVNVDETTYMFSPKVLDRANVIEFKVTHDDFIAYLNNPGPPINPIKPASAGTAENFLILSLKARNIPEKTDSSQLDDIENKASKVINKTLEDLFKILSYTGNEFTYRTANEIVRYIRIAFNLVENKNSWSPFMAIDDQILQKILPKLYGSRRKIENLLLALAKYCNKPNELLLDDLRTYYENLIDFDISKINNNNVVYKKSFIKLKEMINNVRRDQFVSFIQ